VKCNQGAACFLARNIIRITAVKYVQLNVDYACFHQNIAAEAFFIKILTQNFDLV